MPFFEINKRKFFFAHVPKCGGTTVEKGLLEFGVDLHFYDPKFLEVNKKWWSPQHILNTDLQSLISINFFDFCFTIVRDPVCRFLSAFNHQRGANTLFGRTIPWHQSIEKFLTRLEKRSDYFGYRFDNHFCPADFLVPRECKVFYLEDGYAPLKKWICEKAKLPIGGVHFGHENRKTYNSYTGSSQIKGFVKYNFQPKIPDKRSLPSEQRERIYALYRRDYERFYENYSNERYGTSVS